MRRASIRLAIMVAALLAADQLTKLLIRLYVSPYNPIEILPFFSIVYVRNRGIAFGIFEGHLAAIVFTSLIVVLLLAVAALIVRHDGRWTPPFALLMAGSVGNLIDRLFLGSVTDFLRFPHWPAFNFADIFIVAGVLLLVKGLISDMDGNEAKDEGGGDEVGGGDAGGREGMQARAREPRLYYRAFRVREIAWGEEAFKLAFLRQQLARQDAAFRQQLAWRSTAPEPQVADARPRESVRAAG